LAIVVGVVNVAAVTPVNGSGATFGIPEGVTKLIGVTWVSAPRAGATKKTEKSDAITPFITSDLLLIAIFVFMVDPS